MKYPKKYPDGFVHAAKEAEDPAIIEEGLHLFHRALADTLRGTVASDTSLAIYAMRQFLNALKQASPTAVKDADILQEVFDTTVITIKAPRKKEGASGD